MSAKHKPTITVQDQHGHDHDATWITAPVDLTEVALVDTKLAMGLRALVSMIEDKDWLHATRLAYDVVSRLRLVEASETAHPPHPVPADPSLN
jgi:hypothetical protein